MVNNHRIPILLILLQFSIDLYNGHSHFHLRLRSLHSGCELRIAIHINSWEVRTRVQDKPNFVSGTTIYVSWNQTWRMITISQGCWQSGAAHTFWYFLCVITWYCKQSVMKKKYKNVANCGRIARRPWAAFPCYSTRPLCMQCNYVVAAAATTALHFTTATALIKRFGEKPKIFPSERRLRNDLARRSDE